MGRRGTSHLDVLLQTTTLGLSHMNSNRWAFSYGLLLLDIFLWTPTLGHSLVDSYTGTIFYGLLHKDFL